MLLPLLGELALFVICQSVVVLPQFLWAHAHHHCPVLLRVLLLVPLLVDDVAFLQALAIKVGSQGVIKVVLATRHRDPVALEEGPVSCFVLLLVKRNRQRTCLLLSQLRVSLRSEWLTLVFEMLGGAFH